MNADNVLLVARTLLKLKAGFLDENIIRTSLFSSRTHSLESVPLSKEVVSSMAKEILAEYTCNEDNMPHLRYSEAAGIPLLGHFLLRVVRLLKNITSFDFKSVMEFQAFKNPISDNPSTNRAVVVAIQQVTDMKEEKPVLIYEYKPVVHPRAPNVRDILELLIQVFYCFHQYKINSCLLCLMDLHTWHYFKANSNMEIEWVKSVLEEPSSTPGLPALQDHLLFIATAVNHVVDMV